MTLCELAKSQTHIPTIPVGFAKGRTWASLTTRELANYRGFWFNPARFENSLLLEVRNAITAEYLRRKK